MASNKRIKENIATRKVLIEKAPFKVLFDMMFHGFKEIFYVRNCIDNNDLLNACINSGAKRNFEIDFSGYYIIMKGDRTGYPLSKNQCVKIQ